MFEEENAKEIIDNLLSVSPTVLASEDVMQQRGTRDRKLTEKGRLRDGPLENLWGGRAKYKKKIRAREN